MFATRYLSVADCERCEIDVDSAAILADTGHPNYWDAWDEILNKFTTEDGWTLCQDGDLWLVSPDFQFPED